MSNMIRLNNINDIKNFVGVLSGYNGDADVISGSRYVVDAKSIMGLFTLDLSKPVELRLHGEDENENRAMLKNLAAFAA